MRIQRRVHAAHIEETRKVYEISVGKPEGENPLECCRLEMRK